MKLRTLTTTIVGLTGVVLGAIGAASFNLAGLSLDGTGFHLRPMASEQGEGDIGVFLGCALLLLWLGSVVGVVLLSHVRQENRGVRVLGKTVACLSVVIVAGLVFVSLVVLPTAYDWQRY